MSRPDEELKRAADLKLWIESRISELQEEQEKLKEALAVVDSVLRSSTFKPAIDLVDQSSMEIPERREIKKDKGGGIIATALVTRHRVVVEPTEGITLKANTPPLKSFLVGKILEGMKNKDQELVSKGKLPKEQVITYSIDEKNGNVERITVENYREKGRLAETLSTISWTFSRMLEK
jgi:hypothetical protein